MSSPETLDLRLAERLRRANLISEEQLDSVRQMQEESPSSLADALVRLEILSHQEVGRIVESLQEVRFVKLEDMQIDREAVRHIPGRIARMHRCIPVRRTGNMLVIAAADPTDPKLLDALAAVTDCELLVLAAEPEAVEHALFIHYSTDAGAGRLNDNSGRIAQRSENGQVWSIATLWPHTLDTFIDHDAARRARELAKQVAAESPEPIDVPILLIGEPGSGKTHLLHAIKTYRATRNPLSRGLLWSGVELAATYWEYRAAGQSNTLRFELRDRECVLIDDCAGAFGDAEVESELSELIKHCRSTGSHVILALTPEQHLTGPATTELRTTLAKGTEVSVGAPQSEALMELIQARVGVAGSSQLFDTSERVESGIGWQSVIESVKLNSQTKS
ncbi:MAG: hypothetical protein IPG71_12350 [bacterium]|nr:hypothetical protein [bacterium]